MTLGHDHAVMPTPRVSPDPRAAVVRALVGGGPQTPRELAVRTGLKEPYVRGLLEKQAECGRVTYDSTAEVFLITPQQEARLASEALRAHDQEVAANSRDSEGLRVTVRGRSVRRQRKSGSRRSG